MIKLAYASPAVLAMVQVQDVLGLGSAGRMNQPGSVVNAWKWRLASIPSMDLARRLREAAEGARRVLS